MYVHRCLIFTVAIVAIVVAVSIEPEYVNAYTYTNLTIRGAKQVEVVEGAVVDFNITSGSTIYLGVRPLKTTGDITLRINGKVVKLPVVDKCRIEINAANMTSKISVNMTERGCGTVMLYVNGSKAPTTAFVPQYSGLYYLVATDGVFYQKTKVVVIPNISVVNNVFGEVMKINLHPPPRRGLVSIGTFVLPASELIAVDTWSLGAGSYTLTLTMGDIVTTYNLTVKKAVPNLQVIHKDEYTYGESINITVRVFVGRRDYRATVSIVMNRSSPILVKSPSSLIFRLLDVGVYQLYVAVAEDRNITSIGVNRVLQVSPAPVQLDVKINGTFSNPYVVEYGKLLSISAKALSLVEPRGLLTVFVNGAPSGPLVDTLKIGPGLHNLTVVFTPTTRNFRNAKLSMLVFVAPSTPEIIVNKTFSTVYGQELDIPIFLRLYGRPINATARVELMGRFHVFNYTVRVTNGVGVLKIVGIPAGTYLGTVSIAEAPGLLSTKATFNVFVSSAIVKLILDVPKRGVYGEALPVRMFLQPSGVAGRLYLIINGTVVYSGNSSSYQGMWLPPRGGVFKITARFDSFDPNYSSVENITYVFIDRAQCVIHFVLRGEVVNNTVYVLRRYVVQPLVSFPTYIYINGSVAGSQLVFNKTGVYNITVFFPGDDSYYPCWTSQFYLAVKNPAKIEIKAERKMALIDGGLPLVVNLESPVGQEEGRVLIYKINKTYNSTDVEDVLVNKSTVVTLRFKNTGVYMIYAEFLGNDYLLSNRSNVVVVTVETSYFGIPVFLLAVYLMPLAIGFIAAVATKRILKRGI